MKVNLKKEEKIQTVKYNNLRTGVPYVCVRAPWFGYFNCTLIGVDHNEVYGVWLDIHFAVLSKFTPDLSLFEFKEIKAELNEI